MKSRRCAESIEGSFGLRFIIVGNMAWDLICREWGYPGVDQKAHRIQSDMRSTCWER